MARSGRKMTSGAFHDATTFLNDFVKKPLKASLSTSFLMQYLHTFAQQFTTITDRESTYKRPRKPKRPEESRQRLNYKIYNDDDIH
jgi:hypothetical protein